MEFTAITLEVREGVAILTMNRPERLNAINRAMVADIHCALDRVETDDEVRALVLTGAGRAFCSGFDLKDDAASEVRGVKGWRKVLQRDLDFIMRFWELRKPTIAAVH